MKMERERKTHGNSLLNHPAVKVHTRCNAQGRYHRACAACPPSDCPSTVLSISPGACASHECEFLHSVAKAEPDHRLLRQLA